MAYVEVWKSGRLFIRRRVDERRARKGCRVRLGAAGEVRVAIGQSKKLSKFEVHMFDGDPPKAHFGSEKTASILPRANQDFPTLSVETKGLCADTIEKYPEIEGYKIIERLGEGGMGIVWRAEQLSTKRQVALKLMVSHRIESLKTEARFRREVELTASLNHANIARIYDSGIHQGMYYYAMELIDGVPLDRYVRSKALSQRQILELFRIVCQAVLYAHKQAVIHRDLKPSNILVSSDGQPHVLDFGLAKALLEEDTALTISIEGQIAGTPAYMSPEQAVGRHAKTDTRTDVYSLGVILFELLTGHLPHDLSKSTFDILHQIAEGRIKRPREVTKSIDRELETLILKALARKPDDRYASAGELAKDISNYLDGNPLIAVPESKAYRVKKFARKHTNLIVSAASILVVLLISLVITMFYRAQILNMEVEHAPKIEEVAPGKTEQTRDAATKLIEVTEQIISASEKYKEVTERVQKDSDQIVNSETVDPNAIYGPKVFLAAYDLDRDESRIPDGYDFAGYDINIDINSRILIIDVRFYANIASTEFKLHFDNDNDKLIDFSVNCESNHFVVYKGSSSDIVTYSGKSTVNGNHYHFKLPLNSLELSSGFTTYCQFAESEYWDRMPDLGFRILADLGIENEQIKRTSEPNAIIVSKPFLANSGQDPDESKVPNTRDFASHEIRIDVGRKILIVDVYFYANVGPSGFWLYVESDNERGADFRVSCEPEKVIVHKASIPGLHDIETYSGKPTITDNHYHFELPWNSLELVSGFTVHYWFFKIDYRDRMPNSGMKILKGVPP